MTEPLSMEEFYKLIYKINNFARYRNEPIYATQDQLNQIRKINPTDSPELFAPGYFFQPSSIPSSIIILGTPVQLVDKLEDSTIYKYQNREK